MFRQGSNVFAASPVSARHLPGSQLDVIVNGDALVTAQSASMYLTSFLVATICMALLVAAFVQLLAPAMAALGQRVGTTAWLRRASGSIRDVELPFQQDDGPMDGPVWLFRAMAELDASGDDLLREATKRIDRARKLLEEARARGFLKQIVVSAIQRRNGLSPFTAVGVSNEQFMYGVQSEVRAAVAHPSSRVALFLLATAGGSLNQIAVPLVAVDLLAARNPEAAFRLGDAEEHGRGNDRSRALTAAAAAISALDVQVAGMVDRTLDDLQRALARFGAAAMRVVSICLGVAGSLLGSLLLDLPSNFTLWSIGATGGVLAILLRDGVAAAMSRSSR